MNSSSTSSIGIIGVGEIGGAIVDGLCSPPEQAPEIFLSPRNRATAAELADRHRSVRVCADNQDVVDRAGIVLLAVRPTQLAAVLDDLRIPDDRLVISAVAGASHESLRHRLGKQVAIVRAIPLPAVRQRRGITVIHPAHPQVQQLFDGLGGTLVAEDAETLSALQAATATVSAQLDYLTTVATWLADHGMARPEAERYVRSMFFGVNADLVDPDRSLAELVSAHETPAGLNEQLRQTWFSPANSAALSHALDQVYARLTG